MKIDQIVFSERKVPRFLCCEITTDTSVLFAKSVICPDSDDFSSENIVAKEGAQDKQ